MQQPIHYVSSGNGPTVVFVHGLTCALSDWKAQVDTLSKRFRCISVDMRGHGQSADRQGPFNLETASTDLAELLEAEQIDNAIAVGHSWGTRVIALAALKAGARIGGLVMVDGSQQGTGDAEEAGKAINALIDQHPDGCGGFIRDMFGAMFTPQTAPAARDAIIERAVAMPEPVFRSLITDLITSDAAVMQNVYSQLVQPVTVIQSTTIGPDRVRRGLEADEQTPFLSMMGECIEQLEIVVIPGIGHFTQLDRPDSVTDAIESMAQRVA